MKVPAPPDLNPVSSSSVDPDERAAPRFTLLIRTAKLVVDDREYLCVVRDISATGTSIRTFHPIIAGRRSAIEFDSGEKVAVDLVWQKETEAGFQFHTPIEVDEIIVGGSSFPKRDLRFDVAQNIAIRCGGSASEAVLMNLSRQGGSIECSRTLAIDQPVVIEGDGLPEIEARVRWRKEGRYGLVFDTTFSLANLALLIRNLHIRLGKNERAPADGPQNATETPISGTR